MIEYKGYTGVFEYDDSIDSFHGRVLGLRDVVTFQGRSLDELKHEMRESVDDYLALCEDVGKDPEKPYRGEFLVRTTPEVHRKVASQAEASGVSMNSWIESVLTAAVDERLSRAEPAPARKKAPPKSKRTRPKRSKKQSA